MTTTSSQTSRAALLILIGMATLGFSDNLVRFVTTDSSLWQFHLIRSSLVLSALCLAAWFGAGAIWPRRPINVLGRSIFQAGALLIYFGCIAIMPIGVVVAGLFTAPLFVLIIGVVFQSKRVGLIRVAAVAVGFIGAVLVIDPDPEALDLISFLPVFAGLLYAIGAIATRAWCEGEETLTLTFWFLPCCWYSASSVCWFCRLTGLRVRLDFLCAVGCLLRARCWAGMPRLPLAH